MSAYNRLACLSQEHANRIGVCRGGTWRHPQHIPPEVIRENCDILGRGDDEEIKCRVHWYITFHSDVFNACSARGWEYPR